MELPLQFAIAFFGVQVAAWTALILYIRAAHLRRIEDTVANMVAEAQHESLAQAV